MMPYVGLSEILQAILIWSKHFAKVLIAKTTLTYFVINTVIDDGLAPLSAET